MRLTADWISLDATQAVMAALENAGYKAFFVGGCVRNTLLNAPVKDIDIATDAHPQTIMSIATENGFGAVPTGIEHGTVTVISDRVPYEITTFREDVKTMGRHAIVTFSDDVSQDARRRDFTINALYADRHGKLIDPLDGLDDLKARRIRFIEDAARRITEDYLRILRFFRFHAWYGDPDEGMDAQALSAIAQNLDGLDHLSRERVGAEMLRLLAAPDPAPAMAAMRITGVLSAILPGGDDRALAPLVHLETRHDSSPDALRRLAALGGQDQMQAFRLSKADWKRLEIFLTETGSQRSAIELGYRYGVEMGRSILLLRAALLEQPWSDADVAALGKGAEAHFPVTPADLMPELTGEALGKRLRQLEKIWLSSECTLSRDALLEGGVSDG